MMNLEVIPTSANARKLVRLSAIMKLNLDPVVAELAQLDYFDVASVALPTNFQSKLTPGVAEVIQYAADCKWRCILGEKHQDDTLDLLYMTALASGIRPITFMVEGQAQKTNIKRYLGVRGIDFDVVDERYMGSTKDVLVCKANFLGKQAMRDMRKGIVVHLSLPRTDINLYRYEEDDDVWGHIFNKRQAPKRKADSDSPIDFKHLGMEFEHLIFGIASDKLKHRYDDPYYSSKGKKLTWDASVNFHQILPALFPGSEVAIKLFDGANNAYVDTSQHSNNLLKAGFMMNSPSHFAKIMNINMDLMK